MPHLLAVTIIDVDTFSLGILRSLADGVDRLSLGDLPGKIRNHVGPFPEGIDEKAISAHIRLQIHSHFPAGSQRGTITSHLVENQTLDPRRFTALTQSTSSLQEHAPEVVMAPTPISSSLTANSILEHQLRWQPTASSPSATVQSARRTSFVTWGTRACSSASHRAGIVRSLFGPYHGL